MEICGCVCSSYYWLHARPECRRERVAAGWRLYPAPATTNMNQGQTGGPGCVLPSLTSPATATSCCSHQVTGTPLARVRSPVPVHHQPYHTSWWVEWSAGWLRVTGGHILVWSELCMSRTINTKNPGLRPDCLSRGQIRSKWADPTLAVYCCTVYCVLHTTQHTDGSPLQNWRPTDKLWLGCTTSRPVPTLRGN